MGRKIQSLLIVLFFGFMMVLLFRDHVIPGLSRPEGIDVDRAVLTDSWVNQDDYLVIQMGGMELGAMRQTAEHDAETDTYTSTMQVVANAGLLRGRILSVVKMNRRLEMETARVRVQVATLGQPLLSAEQLDAEELPPGAYELAARADGQMMRYRLRRDDAVNFEEMRLTRPVTVADSITPILRGEMLTRNVTYTVPVFDPFGNNAGEAQVVWTHTVQETINETPAALKVVELRFQNMKTTMYVDPAGNVLRREIPLLASNEAVGTAGTNEAKVVLLRRDPHEMRTRFPDLDYVPLPRDLTNEEMVGQDRGQVLKGFSAFGALSGGLMRRQ